MAQGGQAKALKSQPLKIMSYENTSCPCGGKKERETLICRECAVHILATTDGFNLERYQDESFTKEARRNMAMRLLSMARRRNKSLPLRFAM
jgi:hypothetical protein